MLKLTPGEHELSQELRLLRWRLHELVTEQIAKENVRQLGVYLDFVPFHSETVPLVVKLVAETVVPLNGTEVHASQLVGSILFQGIKECGKAIRHFLIFLSGYC